MIKINLNLICFLFFPLFIFSQRPLEAGNSPSNGKILGIIIDATDSKPVEYATVALHNSADSSVVSGALANEKGYFIIDQVKYGSYFIKISFIGYQNYTTKNIIVKLDNEHINLGKIALQVNAKALNEIEIQGEKEVTEHSIDKQVFNVSSNSIVTGGSAQDVLRQVPTITVDQDGNISARGNGNITVWVNGKPSGLTGPNRQAVLDQIPANTIDRVELITNPSARYDAEGMGGIINIILKKNRQDGLNGSVQVGTGTRLPTNFPVDNYFALNKYNGGATLNMKLGKWNISTNYGYRYNEGWHYIESLRLNKFPDTKYNYNDQYNLDQFTTGNHLKRQNHSGTINVDYAINDKNTIGIGATIGGNSSDSPEYIDTKYSPKDDKENPYFTKRRDFSNLGNALNADGNIYYRKTMDKKGEELNISASFSHGTGTNTNNFDEYTTNKNYPTSPIRGDSRFSRIVNGNYNNIGVGQLDYIRPISEKTKIETGAKTTFRTIGTKLNGDSALSNTPDYTRVNEFIFNENIYAAYGLINHNFGFFAIQAGLRSEFTHIVGESLANGVTTLQNQKNYQDYVNLFPSAHVSKKFANDQELRLSYSQRINRPGNETLNPFPTWNNPLDLRYGNPQIRPENVYASEISYNKNWKDHSITATTYYRRTTNSIQRVREVKANGVSEIIFSNVAYLQNYGLEIIIKNNFVKWWSLTTNFNAFGNEIVSPTIQNKNVTADIRQMHTFKIAAGFDIQLSGYYMLPRATLQGLFQGFNGVDIGIRKNVLKKKGTLNLNVSDIFDTRQIDVQFLNNETLNFTGGFIRKGESRIITINFTYKFGKELNVKRGKKAEYNTGGSEGGF